MPGSSQYHFPRDRHVARRADDRLRLRDLPLDRSARHAGCARPSSSRPTTGSRCWSTRARPARAGAGVRRSAASTRILFTHGHADHILGLDEVRRFNALQKRPMPCYGDDADLDDIRQMFAYVVRSGDAARRRAAAARALHDRRAVLRRPAGDRAGADLPRPRPILGFRFGGFAYLTDCSRIPDESWPLLEGLDVLVHRRAARAAAPDALLARRGDRRRRAHRRRGGRTSRTCATISRTRPPAPGCPPGMELAYDGLVVECLMRASGALIANRMNVAHFPDDPPPRWHQPVLALGNFDGLHRGHMKIIDRVRRRAGERGGTPAAMTFDPHPPRVLRPDKAPPLLMTTEQKLEALGARRHAGRRRRPLHARAVALGSRDASCARCWSSGCTSPRSGSAPTSCSATSAPARSPCCAASARATGSAPRRSIRSATRTSSSAARGSAGWSSEGRVDEAGALLGHHYFIDGTVARGAGRGRELGFPDRQPRDRERAAAAGGRLRDDASRSTASCIPSITNIGLRPTFGDVDRAGRRDAHLRRRPRSLRRRTCGCRSCSGCATSGRSRTSTRCARRSTPTAGARGGCSAAFRCRIVRMPQSPDRAPTLVLRLSVPAGGGLRARRGRARRARSPSTSATRAPDAGGGRLPLERVAAARRARRRRRRDHVRVPRGRRRAADRGALRQPLVRGADARCRALTVRRAASAQPSVIRCACTTP